MAGVEPNEMKKVIASMADGEVSKGRWSDDSKIVDHQLDCEAYGGWIAIDDA